MNFKTTGLLVALLIVVGAVWLIYPKLAPPAAPKPPPTETETEAEKGILDPQPASDTLTRLTIERPGKPKLVFERSPKPGQPERSNEWRAVEPVAAPADGGAVGRLVSTFAALKSRVKFEPGGKGAPSDVDAGLSPPAANVTLADKDGTTYAFEIGGKSAMSNDTYVRLAGGKTIHVATHDLLAEVKKDFKEYRDRKLCAPAANDAVRVEIAAEGKSCVLTRGADGAWVLDSPVKAFAAKDEVLGLVRRIAGLQVKEFVDDAPASLVTYGLDLPYLTATVTTETKRPAPRKEDESASQPAEPQFETTTASAGLVIGGFADLKQETRYAKLPDQPWVVSVSQKDVQTLLPDLTKLRDPVVTRVKAAGITTLEITSGGTTATLNKLDGVWKGAGDLADLETPAVVDVLQAFEDLRAIDYVDAPEDLAKCGLAPPRAVLTVTAAGAIAPVTLRVGGDTASGKHTYVQRGDESAAGGPVIVVSAAQAARLAVTPLALRARGIFDFPLERLRSLRVERPDARYALTAERTTWKLTEPADAPADPSGVRTLTTDLSRLRAKSVVAKGDEARFGLDQPAVTIRFELDEAPAASQPATQGTQPASAEARRVEHTLQVARKDKAVYARKDADPWVFELDDTVYDVMVAELIDPRLFTFDPKDVTGVTIVATGGTLDLGKDGDKWKYAPDPFVELAQKKVEDLVKEIAQMRVERYVAYRDGDLEQAGLTEAPASLTLRLAKGEPIVMKMTQERPGQLPRKAALVAQRRICILRQADVEKLMRGLDDYIKTESKPGAKPGAAPEPVIPPPPPEDSE